eukprot:tig00000339_g24184.t1
MNRLYVAALLAQLEPLGPTLRSLSLHLCRPRPPADGCGGDWEELGPALAPFTALRCLHLYAVPDLGDAELRALGAALPALRELGAWCRGDPRGRVEGHRRRREGRCRLARLREVIPTLEAAPLDAYADVDENETDSGSE